MVWRACRFGLHFGAAEPHLSEAGASRRRIRLILSRHSRAGGNPASFRNSSPARKLDPRFRGDDNEGGTAYLAQHVRR
ncbi:hypothetical protein D3876_13410 [Sphingomonas cavernae]|uniref:Uncharacterized protein n=1 Tax=Sphingomonas cavernae TaxID=2320861 RepID=A0A418WMA8_9SPHN|nr:hypothetical protein D3876_13410 [Sphingomonas cavernae]